MGNSDYPLPVRLAFNEMTGSSQVKLVSQFTNKKNSYNENRNLIVFITGAF